MKNPHHAQIDPTLTPKKLNLSHNPARAHPLGLVNPLLPPLSVKSLIGMDP
jgi:hypothetical protein